MFGRQFAYEFGAVRHERQVWQRFRRDLRRQMNRLAMRRGWFGRGGRLDPEEPFDVESPEAPGWSKRFFGRGDLKYVLLELLSERPMHGYEMIKALQERTGGMYTASPGSVYPTLQMLEDRDFVTVSEVDGKKVYTITDAGHAFLAEGQCEERVRRHGRGRLSEVDLAEIAAIRREVHTLQALLGRTIRAAVVDPHKIKALHEFLARMRADLAELAGDADAPEH